MRTEGFAATGRRRRREPRALSLAAVVIKGNPLSHMRNSQQICTDVSDIRYPLFYLELNPSRLIPAIREGAPNTAETLAHITPAFSSPEHPSPSRTLKLQ